MKQKLSAPLLIVAAGLIAGAAALAESGEGDGDNVMLAGAGLGAGMVVLGVYLAGDRRDDGDDGS